MQSKEWFCPLYFSRRENWSPEDKQSFWNRGILETHTHTDIFQRCAKLKSSRKLTEEISRKPEKYDLFCCVIYSVISHRRLQDGPSGRGGGTHL